MCAYSILVDRVRARIEELVHFLRQRCHASFDPSMDQALEHMRATGWRNEGTAGGVSCSNGFTCFRAVEDVLWSTHTPRQRKPFERTSMMSILMMLLMIGDEDCFVVEVVLMMIVTVRVSLFHVAVFYWIGPVYYFPLWRCVDVFSNLRSGSVFRLDTEKCFKRVAHCSLVFISLIFMVALLCFRVLRLTHTHECVYADLWYFFQHAVESAC